MAIRIENARVNNIVGAVYSARNAMNSWDKSDSDLRTDTLGKNDLALAKKLSKSGSDHAKYLRTIIVFLDLTAPLYWWKEFDQYKVGVTTNSCSTMHKIHATELTLDDFSHEHLSEIIETDDLGDTYVYNCRQWLRTTIIQLNWVREKYLETKDKKYWDTMIQLLPSSYNQKRTVQMNYQVLRNIYHARKNHKLDEWRDLCKWIESLPYSELITEE